MQDLSKMKHGKKVRITIIAVLSVVIVQALIAGIAFILLAVKTSEIHDDYLSVVDSGKYKTAVFVEDVNVIKQDVS